MAGIGGGDTGELNQTTRHQALNRQVFDPRGQKPVQRMGLRAYAVKYGLITGAETGGVAAWHRAHELPIIVAGHDRAQLPIKGGQYHLWRLSGDQ